MDRVGLGAVARDAKRRVRAGRGGPEVDVLLLDRLEPGSVFLDPDAVWNQVDVDRAALLAGLHDAGVHVVPFVHDLLPLERPEWFVDDLVASFGASVRAQVANADMVLTNSRATAAGVERLMGTVRDDAVAVRPVVLGADRSVGAGRSGAAGPDPEQVGDLPRELRGRRYLLVVGTLEPRKNQALVLDAFDRLSGQHDDVDLVVVGRTGWHAEDVADRLRSMAAADRRVHWLQGVGDHELDVLYRHAFLVLVPSRWEGYGLPLLEAAAWGVPAITSGAGALAEVGDGLAETADPDDPDQWADAVARHLTDPVHHLRAVERVRSAALPTWADTATEVAGHLRSAAGRPAADRTPGPDRRRSTRPDNANSG